MNYSTDFLATQKRALSAFSFLTDAEKKLLTVYMEASYVLGSQAEIKQARKQEKVGL